MRSLASGRPSSGHCASVGPFSAVLASSGHSSPSAEIPQMAPAQLPMMVGFHLVEGYRSSWELDSHLPIREAQIAVEGEVGPDPAS